jgi:D-alanyl-D-alanine carboxypeptidase
MDLVMESTSVSRFIYTCIATVFSILLISTSVVAKSKHHAAHKQAKHHSVAKSTATKHHATKTKTSHHIKLGFRPKPLHYSSLVMDYPSRTIISSENPTLLNQPASLTKVMTLYLVFQALDNGTLKLSQSLPVSAHAASQQPSKLGLRTSDTITVEEAICGLVTKSANDAASVLAEALGGTEDQFASKMTDQAHKLGMVNTVYRNASGVPDSQQLTTATDMAIMGASILHDFPHYYHFFSLRQFSYHNIVFKSHNHLLGKYEGADGIKTGYTVASGFNLLSSAIRNDHRLIAVVLGGDSIKSRDLRTMQILDLGFNKIANPQPADTTAPKAVPTAPVAPTKTAELDLSNTTVEAEY